MELTRAIRDKVMEERLMLVYRGVVTPDNSLPLLTMLEKEMEDSELSFAGKKRVFMFALESLQNVSRHSQTKSLADMSLVIYSKNEWGYTIATGNVVGRDDVESLTSQLDEINKLDNSGIRDLYRQVLKSTEFNSKGGAGLGLIEMARATGSKLNYDFLNIDDENTYFILTKTVDSSGKGIHTEEYVSNFGTRIFRDLEKLMSDHNVYLIWSGHMNPEVGREVLAFTEAKLHEDDIDSRLKRRVFRILVEILENVALYSPGPEEEKRSGMSVAILRFENNNFLLSTGNLVFNSGIDELKEKIDTVNLHAGDGLKELFVKSLVAQDTETDRTGNMGLIEMARKSGSRLEYYFEPVNEHFSYFTLNVRVENYPD